MLLALAGCALPIAGPEEDEVRIEARDDGRFPFRLVYVNPDIVRVLNEVPAEPEGFIGDLGPSEPRIGPGDSLVITVVEPSAGGLFSGSLSSSGTDAGAKVVTFPESTIDSDGRVNVPFAGTIQVGGLTHVQAADRIRAALTGQAVQPQVMVSSSKSIASRITVGGGVKNPGMLPLLAGGERLLDVVSRAGGSTDVTENAVVQLNRFGNVHRVRLQTLLDDPETNIHVRQGDSIYVLTMPRSYLMLGAVEKVDERHLGQGNTTLASALAQSGGLSDSRAYAQAVMVLRYESPETMDRISAIEARQARAAGLDAPIPPDFPQRGPKGTPIPVVFRLNLRSATGLFMANRLNLHEEDIVYTPDASYTQVRKVVELFGLIASPLSSAARTGSGI